MAPGFSHAAISVPVVISLVNNCPRLYHLDLSGCFQITNRIFEAFKDGSSVDNVNVIVELHLGGKLCRHYENKHMQ